MCSTLRDQHKYKKNVIDAIHMNPEQFIHERDRKKKKKADLYV